MPSKGSIVEYRVNLGLHLYNTLPKKHPCIIEQALTNCIMGLPA